MSVVCRLVLPFACALFMFLSGVGGVGVGVGVGVCGLCRVVDKWILLVVRNSATSGFELRYMHPRPVRGSARGTFGAFCQGF